MNERDRLIELLMQTFDEQYEKRRLIIPQYTADHLLANGVIVPPVKLGQTVYYIVIFMGKPEIFEGKVNRFNIDDYAIWADVGFTDGVSLFEISKEIGKRIFLTKKEAERALQEKQKE